jgi:hypothetical protein
MFHIYGEELLAQNPTPKLTDHTLSAVRDCLFNIVAATLHIEGRSSIRNLRMRHTVVTGNHLYCLIGLQKSVKSANVRLLRKASQCNVKSIIVKFLQDSQMARHT